MKAELLITKYNNKEMGFLLEDGRLAEARSFSRASILGNVYTARVTSIVKNINAAFLDAGIGDMLYYSLADNDGRHIFVRHGNNEKVCVGDILLIQVIKEPVKTKKAEASADITIKGRLAVVNRTGHVGISQKIGDSSRRDSLKGAAERVFCECSDKKSGCIIRTLADGAKESEVMTELSQLINIQQNIIGMSEGKEAGRLIYSVPGDSIADEYIDELRPRYKNDELLIKEDERGHMPLSELFDIEGKLKRMLGRRVLLKSGGSLIIDETEAMTVIDVNSGKAVAAGRDSEKTFLRINKEAARNIARLLRLRNISGMIIIDFISMKNPESYRELIDSLKAELSRDSVKTTYVDTTGLGLVELTRQKIRRPLKDEL